MKEFSVSGQKRATTGKKAAKELRKEGLSCARRDSFPVIFMVRRRVRTVSPRPLLLQSPLLSFVKSFILPMCMWST